VREKLIDAQTPGYQAEFDSVKVERAGAFVEDALSEQAARASQGDDLPAQAITTTRPRRIDLSQVTHIRTASASTMFGCKPGETMFDAIARKEKEEAEHAGAFVEDALSE